MGLKVSNYFTFPKGRVRKTKKNKKWKMTPAAPPTPLKKIHSDVLLIKKELAESNTLNLFKIYQDDIK